MTMLWKSADARGCFTLSESTEIDAGVERVFARWNRYEELPRFLDSVRRTKRIDEERVLWDADVAGHQLVWEARIVELVPERRVRWRSSWGAPNSGEARFEALREARTRLSVEIEYRPGGLLEGLGARLGLPDRHVRRDLDRFRRAVEALPADEPEASWRGSRSRSSTSSSSS